MAVRLRSGIRIRRQIRRRAGALVGIFAILFQAAVLASHHHGLPFHSRAASGVTILTAPSSPVIPSRAEHECEICLTLGHQGAVPIEFFWARPPEDARPHRTGIARVDAPLAPYLLFRPRAPPAS
jgi:hypothetical protein